jgi:SAM-dependent methyltransferase
MPISWESHHKIEQWTKPCGGHKWHDDAVERACRELAGKGKPVVLDAGCGSDSWIIRRIREQGMSPHVIGFDIDDSCRNNKEIDEAKVASIYEVPFESESVDLAMSGYVFEHLEDPDSALKEIRRVLKPGARLISWTPNKWNPIMLISAVTSQRLHVLLRRLTWGAEGADNAPTYYRINTVSDIRSVAKRNGFICEYVDTYSSAFGYFRMNKVTFFLACAANKIMALWPFNKFRLTLLCVLRKPEATD